MQPLEKLKRDARKWLDDTKQKEGKTVKIKKVKKAS